MRRLFLFFLPLLFFVLVFNFNNCIKQRKNYKIGVITNLNASNSFVGLLAINSLNSAIKKISSKNFTIYAEDGSWKKDKIYDAFIKIKNINPDILVLITTSTSILTIKNMLIEENIPTISLSATTTKISDTKDNIFSFIPNLKEEQKAIAEYMNNNSIDRIFIIKETKNFSYTEPALNSFSRYYKGKILSVYPFETSNLDVENLINFLKNVKKLNVKGIYFLAGYSYEPGIIIQYLRKFFPDEIPIILTPWSGEASMEIIGDNLKNIIIPFLYDIRDKNKAAFKFFKKFKEVYNENPTLTTMLSYEAGCIIGKIINSSLKSITSKNFLDFLKENRSCFFENVKISKFGDVKRKFYFIKIEEIMGI